jgi:hypothetical protein
MPAPDFTLTPDNDDDRAETRPLRLVSTGLAPTQEAPYARTRQSEATSYLAPCPQCGVPVLTVGLADTSTVTLHPPESGGPHCYVATWDRQAPQPQGVWQSRAMAVHQCGNVEKLTSPPS